VVKCEVTVRAASEGLRNMRGCNVQDNGQRCVVGAVVGGCIVTLKPTAYSN